MAARLLVLLVLGLGSCCWLAAASTINPYVGPASYLDVVFRPNETRPAEASRQLGARLRALNGSANPRNSKPYKVCISNWVPMVRCSADEPSEDFKGYMVELFRMLAGEVSWEAEDYEFSCMHYSEMMADLQNPNGSCSMSATGVMVFPEYLAAGLKFSWPTYKGGLRILIYDHLQSGSTWAFSEVFHWTVWLALGGTAVAVGLLVAALEAATPHSAAAVAAGGKPIGWQQWLWYSLAKMMHVINHVGDPASDASRILILGYSFLVLVMVSMYTAVSASRITAEKLVNPIHNKKDLPGRRVLTWDKYVPVLAARHDTAATGMPWDNEEHFQDMLAALRAGQYDALVLDSAVLEFTVGTNDACDLFVVGEPFETFSLALAFPPDFDDAVIFQLSSSIVALQTYQGAVDMLDSVYVKTGGSEKCFSSGGGGHATGETIQLRQVSGLWYILLITVGCCFILTLIHNLRKDPTKAAAIANLRKHVSFTGYDRHSDLGGGHPHSGFGGHSDAGGGGSFTHASGGSFFLCNNPPAAAAGGAAAAAGAGAPAGHASPGAVTAAAGSTPWQSPHVGTGPSVPTSGASTPAAERPSKLQAFLGVTSFNYRDDSDDEAESPKKKPPKTRFAA